MRFKYLTYPVFFAAIITLGLWFRSGSSLLDLPGGSHDPSPAGDIRAGANPGTAASIAPSTPFPGLASTGEDPILARLNGFLANGQYEEAVELYGELYSRLSEAESKIFRDAILRYAGDLAAQNDHHARIALLGAYTDLFFKDLPALRMLAHSQHALKLYPAEVETILLALNEGYLVEDIIELNGKLESAVVAQDLLFIQQDDPEGAVEFHRSLALLRPDSVPFQIGLARALVHAGDIDEAVSLLDALPDSAEYAGQIDRLKQMAEATRPRQATAIPLSRAGRSFVLEATVNGEETVRLLVDTGATLTIIRPEALRRAGVGPGDFVNQTTLETAGGKINASVYRIESLRLGPELVHNVTIGSVEIPGLGDIDGLLGMNVLNRFTFAIDQAERVMLLTR